MPMQYVLKSLGVKAMARDEKSASNRNCNASLLLCYNKEWNIYKTQQKPCHSTVWVFESTYVWMCVWGSLPSNVGLDLKRLPGAKVLYNASEDPC